MRLPLIVLGLTFSLGLTTMTSTAAEPSGRLLRHIVMYKFKDDQSAKQIQEVADAFAALPKKVDTIVDFEQGTNVSAEGKSEGFTHVFLVTFRNQQALATYLEHPAHLEYVKLVRDRREKVIVFDYWTE